MKIVINGESVEVNGDAVPQDSSGGGEVYSTEETRIGTWIDGKPLYRKTLVGTSPGQLRANDKQPPCRISFL